MASISGCAKADKADLVGHLSSVIGVGDEEDTIAKLIEWPRLKGSCVEYLTGSSRFKELCKAKSSIDGIWGHAFAYRGNFFRTCSVSQGGDYLYLLPDLAKVKKYRRLGDEVSLEYVQGIVKVSRTDGFCCYLSQFDYGLTLPLSNLAKSVMNLIGVCPTQLNCNFWEVIFVCNTLNGRWAASGSEMRITAKDFMEYYAVKYVTTTNGAYLCSSSARPCFFDLSSAGRVWNDNLLWVSGINCKVSRKESFIDLVAREDTELEAVLNELEISRFKRVASKDDKVRRSQAKRKLVGKSPGSMEEKLKTSELNIPLKLPRLNEILDGPVDMATVSGIVVRNLAKRKTVKRGLLLILCHRSVWMIAVRGGRLKQISWRNNAELKLERRWLLLWMMSLRRKKDLPARGGKKLVGREADSGEGRFPVGAGERKGSCCPKNEKELDAARKREEHTLLYNAEYTEEYEAFISQYEDGLDDNVKLSLKLEEAKGQVEEKTATTLSRDLVLNQLTSELAELKEKAASGSRHEA
ncbi:hypothetical protein GIB67_034804 [Kingdonia uniflora]|uniref:Uncharacterized protein n=1 Tax=Kingdonia uniflora TaxID=39325 RepID=A0A7J7ME47_9MAGN|nr:hypothetical protein GIB67_034804 [Kingdonia uniflora]